MSIFQNSRYAWISQGRARLQALVLGLAEKQSDANAANGSGRHVRSESVGICWHATRLVGAEPVSQLAKRDQAIGRLIPEHKTHASKALTQTKPAQFREFGMVAKSKRQPVKRHPAAQVVNMVNADIGGEPAQHRRQIVVRAAIKRRSCKIPIAAFGPNCVLELVLHVEQPHAGCSTEDCDRQMHKQKRPDTDPPNNHRSRKSDRRVRRHGADPRCQPFPLQAEWKAVAQNEKIDGTDAEHKDRMTVEAITEATPTRQRQIFIDGERVDVTDATVVEVARGRMMDAVRAPPDIVRSQ